MKKLSLVLMFFLLLTIILSLSTLAYEMNVSNEAVSTSKDPTDAWIVTPNCLIDGDRSTGTSAWQKTRYTSMTVTFNREVNVSKLVFVVNGIGEYPGSYGAISFSSMSENQYWFHVYLLDQSGNTVKDLGNYQSWNANENQELIIDVSYIDCYQVKVTLDNQYNNLIGLWELEIYEHVSCDFDILKETLSEPNCIESGKGIYSCKCGETEEREIPPSGNHQYTDFESFTYPNGLLSKGVKIHGCPTCNDYTEEETEPIFKFLGYSISRNGSSICVSYVVNKSIIPDYEKANNMEMDYGVLFAVSDSVSPLTQNGTVADGINGQAKSLKNTNYPRFDLKVSSSNWSNSADTPLIICAYIVEGDKLTYICTNTNSPTATSITYSQL